MRERVCRVVNVGGKGCVGAVNGLMVFNLMGPVYPCKQWPPTWENPQSIDSATVVIVQSEFLMQNEGSSVDDDLHQWPAWQRGRECDMASQSGRAVMVL